MYWRFLSSSCLIAEVLSQELGTMEKRRFETSGDGNNAWIMCYEKSKDDIWLQRKWRKKLVVEATRNNHDLFVLNRVHKAIHFINSARPIPLKIKFKWLWFANAFERSVFHIFQQAFYSLDFFRVILFPPSVIRVRRFRKFNEHVPRM